MKKKNLQTINIFKILVDKNDFLTWEQVKNNVLILSEYLGKIYLKETDVFYYLKIDLNGLFLI